jgi:type VI secretion system protein ImpK
LIAAFRELYGEVVRAKRRVARRDPEGEDAVPAPRAAPGRAGALPAAPGAVAARALPAAAVPGDTPTGPLPVRAAPVEVLAPHVPVPVEVVVGGPGAAAAAAVRRPLLAILERQAVQAARAGAGWGTEVYRQAQYAMAVLADETFLHLAWDGREAWRANLLESRLFGSHHAGDELFARIDALLRSRDPLHFDLAEVYLLTLGLGFEGRYRGAGPEGAERLAVYRRDLFSFLANREPELADGKRRLVPDAYASTLDAGDPPRLPYLKRWLLAGGVVLVAWLVGQHLMWRELVSRLAPELRVILGAG